MTMGSKDDVQSIERNVLQDLAKGSIDDSREYAKTQNIDHDALVGVVRSLSAHEMVTWEESSFSRWALTKEAQGYLEAGSPEAQVFYAVVGKPEGVPMSQLRTAIGNDVASVGFKQAMQMRWVSVLKKDKKQEPKKPEEAGADGQGKKTKAPKEEPIVRAQAETIEDSTKTLLMRVQQGEALSDKETAQLKKRKLIVTETWRVGKVSRGPKFALERKKEATDLTRDMLVGDAWSKTPFKKYNFSAMGRDTLGGHLHPLLKVRTQFRKIFTRMGFEEMPTNRFVESSFWNFDSLFQPQQHPARDAHDTFFMTSPSISPITNLPDEYVQKVKKVHEDGGYGSIGYGYNWKISEAEKNLLRTHTTAVSSRMLYLLAKEYEKTKVFKPKRYFSIDRVFRNESVDRTHLAEFHQVEGFVADYNLSLAHLLGTIEQFCKNIGMPEVKFKPAYNPYTEPSMEIFAFHPGLQKWLEVGNSGVFRPEMLAPMGLPEGVSVVAWGIGLERQCMILYGIDNIRELFGHKVDLEMMKENSVCRIGL